MHTTRSILACLIAVGLLFCSSPAEAKEDIHPTRAITLSDWKVSPAAERNAFLCGMAHMIGLEHFWRDGRPLPIGQSIIGSWEKGIMKLSTDEINDALDKFAAAHPEMMDMSVMEALGRIYVYPAMTEAEKKAAAARYNVLMKNHR